MMHNYNQTPLEIITTSNRDIAVFPAHAEGGNIDTKVVESFGEEWMKFNQFDTSDLEKLKQEYFDIVSDNMVNKNTYGIDIGCGTGRWTLCLLDRIGFMEAVDPSRAILAADKLLAGHKNVRLSVAATDNLPFPDETFDFAMSIGVLHHIPDTKKAMYDCVSKVKRGGYFYTYLYYSLDNKGLLFKFLLLIITGIRKIVSKLPGPIKRFVCDILAILIYMPVIIAGRVLKKIGFAGVAKAIPLSSYQDKSFFIIRNDALDRFGTALEQRFSREQIIQMMTSCGLENIIVSEKEPFWHAVGQRSR